MKIVLAKHIGFCGGVNRAMETALKTAKNSSSEQVYMLGHIVHNKDVVEKISKAGVIVTDNIKKIKTGILIIRSHGATPEIFEKAKTQKLKVVDATCPIVAKAQNIAKRLKDEGYQVIVLGDRNHDEVKGIVGATKNTAIVVSKPKEVQSLKNLNKVGLIVQTTQNIKNFINTASALLPISSELRIYNTLCKIVDLRQKEADLLAKKVDLVLVIGSFKSANTKQLTTISKNTGVKTHQIERASQLKKHWFNAIKKVGVVTGTSTPEWVIKDVVSELTKIGKGLE
ncbi:MAG: 4-hydroxy-3-methylbut-2-enyl diphosphate reductase [Candidatus Levybacteria bacterium CG10_big_fil_rev_8_21_14_0_10_36_7]|nr:MAG: 4-hydroxy-3-methylbut-2-enyl diphosphate reductase [Candidatus Levybacteria bacterium CG10_big_fil_rev_8_21_14_0_10_36_7]